MSEKKFDKQRLITAGVTALLIFFFIGGFLIGLDRVQSMEGTFPPNEITEALTPAPENEAEAADFFVYVLNKALENTACVTKDVFFEIDKASIVTDGSDGFNASVLFAADKFINHISGAEENDESKAFVNYGGDISSVLEIAEVKNYTVTDFSCSYIYYVCPSCGAEASELLSACEKCGSGREYFKKYRDEYDIEFSIMNIAPGAAAPLAVQCEGFSRRTDEEISALTSSVFDGAINIDKLDITYNSYRVKLKVNRLTDEITYLCYTKEMSVASEVTFTGKYESIGTRSIGFDINEKRAYNFSWPCVTLDSSSVVIEPKGSDNLLAALTCENPLDAQIVWSSSDESIAVVDGEGYIDAKKEGEATITASFDYLGRTYSDSCTVYVRVPVESMKMSQKKLTLTVGESFSLQTKISPSDATIKTVKWYSEDEKIAVVNENGEVTAVAGGKVIVYALSDDGYFRSTCEVTVE